MVQSSPFVTNMARRGATLVQQGEVPELKNPKKLSELHGEQNIDFFESSLKELQARDNSDGDVSIHVFRGGPDQDDTLGKLEVGNMKAEFEGDTQNGTRFSVESHGEVEKMKAHRFDDDKIVVFEATVKPGEEMTSSVLVLDRENPEESLIGSASSNWLLGL